MFCVPDNLKGIAETLFLSLYFRAVETLRADALVNDPLSVALVSQIDYDFSRLKPFGLMGAVVSLRVRRFDRCVKAFVTEHPHATIVNLGCGLDTRFHRLDNGFMQWYEVDLPEVIAFRENFFDQTHRYRYVNGSVLDTDILGSIAPDAADGLLILAEGLFPYFDQSQLRRILMNMGCCFPGAMLVFDAVSPVQALLSQFHPAFHIPGACFRWGMNCAEILEQWVPGARIMWQCYYFSQPELRLGCYNLLQVLPHVRCGFSVVALRFGPL